MTNPPRSLSASIGAHPVRTLLVLLGFLVVAGVVGGPVAGALEGSGGFVPTHADSNVGITQLEDASGHEPDQGIVLLVRTPDGPSADASRVRQVAAALRKQPGIVAVQDDAVARNQKAVLVTGTLSATADDDDVADQVLDTFSSQHDVVVGGSVVANRQVSSKVGADLGRAEALAFPVLIVLALLIFRGRAALMPLITGATTVLGTFLVLAGVNQLHTLSIFALNLVIGLGLGLSIDYSLFLVTRYREELARQGATPGAICTTMRTAGRTVAFSAATVAVALATLTVYPLNFLVSMGVAGATVAVVAALASLVIAPAIFGLWGAKLARKQAPTDDDGRWYRFSHAVMRRPGVIAAVTGVVMLALAAPALRTEWSPIDNSVIPTSESARTVADASVHEFRGAGDSPTTVAVTTSQADDATAVATYAAEVSRLPGLVSASRPRQLDAHTWQLDLVAQVDPGDAKAQQLVRGVRSADAPAGVDTKVIGPAAEFVDQQHAIGSRLPIAIGLLVLLTLLVLWLLTGSVVLPVKAVVMNALTVGASLAVITVIYQGGHLTGLLGYTPNGGVEPTDFLVTFAVVFALSTDYGVFLLGRIKEVRDGGEVRAHALRACEQGVISEEVEEARLGPSRRGPSETSRNLERESVAVGLQRTGRVVTAAAILLAVAIGAFSTSSISFIQQIGVATAFGVLIDAFIVRSLLVPSLMGLLGKYNWWSPMPLRRLHDRINFAA